MQGPAPASRVAHLDDGTLATFRRDGYVVVRGFLGPDAMDRVEAWSEELAALPELPGRHMVYHEDRVDRPGERVLARIENFCAFHPGFDGLLRGSPLVEAATALLDGPAVLFKDKINYKMPGGQGFRAHQDVQAGWDRYATLASHRAAVHRRRDARERLSRARPRTTSRGAPRVDVGAPR